MQPWWDIVDSLKQLMPAPMPNLRGKDLIIVGNAISGKNIGSLEIRTHKSSLHGWDEGCAFSVDIE